MSAGLISPDLENHPGRKAFDKIVFAMDAVDPADYRAIEVNKAAMSSMIDYMADLERLVEIGHKTIRTLEESIELQAAAEVLVVKEDKPVPPETPAPPPDRLVRTGVFWEPSNCGMTSFSSVGLLTDGELKVLEGLVDALDAFEKLPADYTDSKSDFRYGIRVLQQAVMSRPVRRQLNMPKG